jgi:hypothetical protein
MSVKAKLAVVTAAIAAVLLVPTTATPTAQQQRPHGGVCWTSFSQSGPRIDITGTCQLTHLGRTQVTASQGVFPTGPPVDGALPIALANGEGTYTAADGDELRFEYSGTGEVDLGSGRVDFRGASTYTGGSGRFARASGGSVIWGMGRPDGTGWVAEMGSITY